MIRVLIVDDQAVVRQGLRSMLEPEMDIKVVGEAQDGQQALELVNKHSPDVVLMDVRMPNMDGLTALERIKNLAPQVSVIMATLYDDPEYLFRAISAGAAGYILKDARRESIVRAIRVTREGGAIIAPSMMPQLLHRVAETMNPLPQTAPGKVVRELSQRELQVLRLIAEGCTNQDIADELILSPTTIKTHVQNILRKLDVSDRTQAAVYAVRRRLI